MQWDNTPNAGFTTGIPWLPIPVSYKTHNVASELEASQFDSHVLQDICWRCATPIRRCWMAIMSR